MHRLAIFWPTSNRPHRNPIQYRMNTSQTVAETIEKAIRARLDPGEAYNDVPGRAPHSR
jgi:hypothetical protein